MDNEKKFRYVQVEGDAKQIWAYLPVSRLDLWLCLYKKSHDNNLSQISHQTTFAIVSCQQRTIQ